MWCGTAAGVWPEETKPRPSPFAYIIVTGQAREKIFAPAGRGPYLRPPRNCNSHRTEKNF